MTTFSLFIHIHLGTEMKSVSQLLQIPDRAGIGVVLGVDGDTLEHIKNIPLLIKVNTHT